MALTVIDDIEKEQASLIASVVRNELEDFHSKYLSDEQMAELNPILRNAIVTAIHALNNVNNETVKAYVDWNKMLIPEYWEEPKLTEDFLQIIKQNELQED